MALQNWPPKSRGVTKIGFEELRLLKFRAYQIGFSKMGLAVVDLTEFMNTKINLSQISPLQGAST